MTRLQECARVGVLAFLDGDVGEKEQRDGALRVVGERALQVFLRFVHAAAEEAGHLKYQRPSARSAEPCCQAGSIFSARSSAS